MSLFVLIVVTGLIFLIADAVMLTTVIKPLFERHIGDTLLGGIRAVPAALFYLLYVAGVTWFRGLARLARRDAPHRAPQRRDPRPRRLWHL